jgi:hypothetical protein
MTTPQHIKAILIVSLGIGSSLGIVAPCVGNLHVYRVASGYSGEHFWLAFPSEPTEQAILDAVIYREPLITDRFGATQAWRAAQKDGTRLCIKRDAATSIVIAPYDATKDPDTVFTDGRRVKGIWLTEPATRTRMPAALVGMTYSVTTFLAFFIGTFSAVTLVRWIWYFLLRRISELTGAVTR